MAFFKCAVAGKVYELDKLTLGEARFLKRDFGLSDLAFFSASDPDVMAGLLVAALMRQGKSQIDATTEVDALDIDDFEPITDAEPDPTGAADGGEDESVPSGKPATARKKTGSPS